MDDDILEFDVNSVIKDEIRSLLKSYEDRLSKRENENYKLRKEISELKTVINSAKDATFLLDHIRKEFSQIKNNKDRFLFIGHIMNYIFNIKIKKEYNRIPEISNFTKLEVLLAVYYYDYKEIIINLLNIIKIANLF